MLLKPDPVSSGSRPQNIFDRITYPIHNPVIPDFMIVMKFGGTSVATAARIKDVARIIRQKQKEDKNMAVVFSAFGGVTDDLIHMSRLAAGQDKQYKKVFEKIRQRHVIACRELGLAVAARLREKCPA